ncbi:helix-turn-helix domain-containing protein [Lolliginicoccus levis]|uniref:helix-turn-helix domain-containing protein n=1 Tax=Lolliginicoccus levis TaxID=2919542 RepID=UPI00241F4E72|nr:helix-turn-helix domain-containing protein [Lolliginicoccus levis]
MSTTVDRGAGIHLSLTDDELAQARRFATASADHSPAALEITARFSDGASIPLPPELAHIVGQVVAAMSRGGTITIGTIPEELTTTTAATMLGISRPTLMKLIERGELPAHKVGSHTRLSSKDVLARQEQQRQAQLRAFEELRDLEDTLGLDRD